jgi:hypothetical protein
MNKPMTPAQLRAAASSARAYRERCRALNLTDAAFVELLCGDHGDSEAALRALEAPGEIEALSRAHWKRELAKDKPQPTDVGAPAAASDWDGLATSTYSKRSAEQRAN